MKCYLKDQCKKFKDGVCNEDRCGIQLLTTSAYNGSNIPKRYRKNIPLIHGQEEADAVKTLVEFKNNVLEHVENGDGLFIYSKNCGNGKTSWATKIARQYIIENAFKQKHENLVYFVNVTDYLEMLRQSFNDKEANTKELEDILRTCDLLILDDLGAEKPSEWVTERLYSLINYRINEEKSIIVTSNLTITELEIQLSDRIASRLYGCCDIVTFTNEDRRK